MFFWRRVAPQIPEEGLKPTATPGYTRNFRDLNDKVSQGKSFSGYEKNPLFLNLGGDGFAEVAGLLDVNFDDDARAVAVLDWDRDGDLDMWVTNRTAPRVRLLQNNQPSTKSSISIHLIGNGKTTNRDAIGARLTLSQGSDSKQIRTVRAGEGFLAQSSKWSHFGTGKKTESLGLVVDWPGGETETFSGLEAGGRYTIRQGAGQLQKSTLASLSAVPEFTAEAEGTGEAAGMSGFWVANQVPFPELVCKDNKGATRSTTDFLGKPLLVNFWATWCLPCLEELSMLGEHADEIRAQGATVLALNVDGLAVDGSAESSSTPEEVLARAGYSLPYGFARQENLAKIEILVEYLSARRMPMSIPSSFLIDAKGNVAAVYLEAVGWEQLAGDLALLNATPAEQLKRSSPRAGRWFVDPRQIDRDAYVNAYATLFATSGFPEESQRLYGMVSPKDGTRTAQEYYNQAKVASQQGNTEEAMEFYRAAIKLEPEYGQALTGLGAVLLMQKRIEEAQPLFEKALSIDPNHATALINLAMIDQSRGNKDSARARLEQVISRNPEYAEAHLNLGSLLASMKKYEEAIQHLTTAIQLNPRREHAHLNLAAAYVETEQWKNAEEAYLAVQQLSPKMAYPHYGMGVVLARQGSHADAVESFRMAISLGGGNSKTLTQFGLSLREIGDAATAEQAFRAALKLDPANAVAQEALEAATAVKK